VNRWPIRFASATALGLLAACSGAPRRSPAPGRAAIAAAALAPVAAKSGGAPPGGATATPIPVQAAAGYAAALGAMRAGRTAQARSALQTLASRYPQFNGPLLSLGMLELAAARLPQAEAALRRVLAREPENPAANDELGMVLRRLGRFRAAESAYARAIAARPDDAAAHLNLGILYDLYLGEPRRALAEYQRYLAIAGKDPRVEDWVIEVRRRIGVAAPPATPGTAAPVAPGAAPPATPSTAAPVAPPAAPAAHPPKEPT